jgi:hypothetical protein
LQEKVWVVHQKSSGPDRESFVLKRMIFELFRGLNSRRACLAGILCLAWLLMPGSAAAWFTLSHPYLTRIAFDQMPGDFQDRFRDHMAYLLAGSLAPDLALMDWSNHEWNVHAPKGEQGGAPARVESLFNTIQEELTGQAPDDDQLAYDLGLLSHYLADINQPLHTDETDLESLAHVDYEWDVHQRLGQFTFLNHGGLFFLDPYADTIALAESANPYYDQIIGNYTGGTRYQGLERITALQLQSAVDSIADAWTTLWLRTTASGPSVGIRTNQAFFTGGDSVEITLSTLAGKEPTANADIYVAAADQRGGLWFVDSNRIDEWPPVPWRSGNGLTDGKSVVLAFQLGKIGQESCYDLYAVAVQAGKDPLNPQWWLAGPASAHFCLEPP